MKFVRCASAVVCVLLCHVACGDDSKSSKASPSSATHDDEGPAGGMGAPATTDTGEKVSKPGEYKGYSKSIYKNGYQLSSEYVAVSDGTKLAVDLYRPKDASGK